MGWSGVKGVHINRSRGKRGLGKKDIKGFLAPDQRVDPGHRPFAHTTSPALCSAAPSLDFLTCLTALLGYSRKAGSTGPENAFMSIKRNSQQQASSHGILERALGVRRYGPLFCRRGCQASWRSSTITVPPRDTCPWARPGTKEYSGNGVSHSTP